MYFLSEKAKLLEGINIEGFLNILKEANAIIAGGAITSVFTNREIKDYDIYFRDEKSYNIVDTFLNEKGELFFDSNNAKTYSLITKTIQLIKPTRLRGENVFDIINTFDFTICMGAYDFRGEEFGYNYKFLLHNAQKILVFNIAARQPMSSLIRVLKFKERGYSISSIELIKIALAINNINIKDNFDLADNLRSIQATYLYDFYNFLSSEDKRYKQYNMTEAIIKLEEFNDKNLKERCE
jgi:hypothetical protein